MQQTKRRMSIRAVALDYGIPARVVSRAVDNGELAALKTITETGRVRAYISREDVDLWLSSITKVEPSTAQVQ